MKTFSQLIQGLVHTAFRELKEECDLNVDVNVDKKIVKVFANNNPPLTVRLWATSKIKHDLKGFKDYIKNEIQKELIKPSYASLYLASLVDGTMLNEVNLFDINVKSFLDESTFSFYADREQFAGFEKLNKDIVILEKVVALEIPEGNIILRPLCVPETLTETAPTTTEPTVPTLPTNFNNFIQRIGGETSLSRTDSNFSYSDDICVFVFDTGIERHPLLTINEELSRDFSETTRRNGIVDGKDEDPSSLFRTGWSVDSNNRNRTTLSGHGTHVAGTIGAKDGRFAVAPGIPVIAYKILPGNTETTLTALEYLSKFKRNNPSKKIIVNLSIGFSLSDQQINSGVILAYEKKMNTMSSTQNITFVVAAGNNFMDTSRFSPARVDSAITVGSYDNTITPNQISNFSNFGQSIDILSPGNRIFSTWLANDFRAIQGTSMAAPVVAGAVVNMLTVEAGNLTPQQIKQRLQDDAKNSFQSGNNAEVRLPIQYRGDCPETNNICTFPPTFPYSVYIGKHTVTKTVQNY
jgi:hypothetical protein